MAYTTIDKPTDYFNTVTYTGNGTDGHSITGVGFQPDFCWFKARGFVASHALVDSVRGTSKTLRSDNSSADFTSSAGEDFSSFDSDGFTVDEDGTFASYNFSGASIVTWNWKAGGTASSNTDGSITSTVSANTTSGFSIVSYTGNGTGGATIGHGLGVSPSWIVTKKRSATGSWVVYHKSQGATKYGILDTTASFGTSSSLWNDTEPTSSVFSVGTDADTNGSSATFIAYCFAEKKGFSKFGSYTGNGNADGPFVYTGFKPAFVIIKGVDTSGDDWFLYDNKREGYNQDNDYLRPNANIAEVSADNKIDILSNGFKMRTSNTGTNRSGDTYITMAFAENPFVTSTGIPTTAR